VQVRNKAVATFVGRDFTDAAKQDGTLTTDLHLSLAIEDISAERE
jgi:hypothetical protein